MSDSVTNNNKDKDKAQAAMREVIAVLKKHDVGAAVSISTMDRTIFRYHMPNWSIVQIEHVDPEKGTYFRIRSKAADFDQPKMQDRLTGCTISMIGSFESFGMRTVSFVNGMLSKIKAAGLEWETTEGMFDPELDLDPDVPMKRSSEPLE